MRLLWLYIRVVVILAVYGLAISAYVFVPLFLGLAYWFGGSAYSALREGRTDALIAHTRWTAVTPGVFYVVLIVELLAIASALALMIAAAALVFGEWRDRRLTRR